MNQQLLEMPASVATAEEGLFEPQAPLQEREIIAEPWDWLFCSLILVGFATLLYCSFFTSLFRPLWLAVESHRWGHLLVRPSLLWTVMGSLLFLFRTALWFRYRPFQSCSFAEAPSVTVVIPAYNEGPMVMQSIQSIAEALYPEDRLEIFVVDDGSTDDTWTYIKRAASKYPDLVRTIRLPRNQGKRAALAAGFRNASGELIVTLDSDSEIDPDALLAIAGPFRNEKIGAVAGKVTVYNRRCGIIPRMLHVQYILSFDLLRAVESSYGTVYCCPGALTAYRSSVLHQVLDDWMGQSFLGAPCTYGEDRAMTNLILASGYDTVYQRTAHVRTVVPEKYRQLCRMFLRWDRSYVREEIKFMSVVWKRPLVPRLLALWDRTVTNLRFPLNTACFVLLAALVVGRPLMIFRILTAIGLVSLVNMVYYLRSERSKDFVYGICFSYFSFFTMFWIFPYAVLTVRARSWLTR